MNWSFSQLNSRLSSHNFQCQRLITSVLSMAYIGNIFLTVYGLGHTISHSYWAMYAISLTGTTPKEATLHATHANPFPEDWSFQFDADYLWKMDLHRRQWRTVMHVSGPSFHQWFRVFWNSGWQKEVSKKDVINHSHVHTMGFKKHGGIWRHTFWLNKV